MKDSTKKIFESYIECITEATNIQSLLNKKVILIDIHGDEWDGKLSFEENYFFLSDVEDKEFHQEDISNVTGNMIKLKISLS